MATKRQADANPEKRLFISLLTRDIPLVAAFLDLIDNSVNAAVEPLSERLQTAADYISVLNDASVTPTSDIIVKFSEDEVSVVDNAAGISAETAEKHVFKFGRAANEAHEDDRLSVYGIGMKRAIFKLGNKIRIRSEHVQGGFDLDLDVDDWEAKKDGPWQFTITEREPVLAGQTGTTIKVTELYDDTKRRLSDGLFESQLRDAISRTYSFYLSKFVRIMVGEIPVEGTPIEIGANHATDQVDGDGVTCAITAGIGVPQTGGFRDKSSGWFVFCNGRTIVSADKGPLTGWGGNGLPIFQPKHRPFVGTAFFVSKDAEKLPWTTTKASINEDSVIWQEAKRHMIAATRLVINFLDSRYTDDGVEVPAAELQEAAGARVGAMAAAVGEKRAFQPPTRPRPETIRIQYDAKVADVAKITEYLGRPSMSGSDVGRHTFQFYLKNEVGT